ncbi:MAG: exonuclease domain-containing protein [Bacteroidota bacterium]
MKRIFPFFLLCLVGLYGCIDNSKNHEAIPPLPQLSSSAKDQGTPASNPENWIMAHVDVETTGLVPGYHQMIDLGLVMTDLKGDVVDSLFIRIQPSHPERTSDGARRVNGYDEATWEKLGAIKASQAVDSLRLFHDRVAQGRKVVMTSFNSHFDAAFLDHLFREANQSWRELYHYFILDIPSMAWSLGYQDFMLRGLMEEREIEDEPHVADQHTGITGAMKNVRIYKELMKIQEESVN